MKVYGYPKGGNDLQELVEITLQAEPMQLRKLASFLLEMAQDLEANKDSFDHGHVKDYVEGWPDDNPEIIVFQPNS